MASSRLSPSAAQWLLQRTERQQQASALAPAKRRLTQKIVYEKDEDCIGFASLPDQVHRKAVKRGFHFTIMVVGESGLGKSTLINSLFSTDLYAHRRPVGVEERISRTVEMSKNHLDIEEGNVRLRMTIVDTPGFGDSVRGQQSYKPVEEYIDEQFLQYFQDESGLNRRTILDNRVHCLLYFISPSGHGLKPLDIEVMKRLQHKVNIIPIIAKADTLTTQERRRLKGEILDDFDKYDINIYDFPECDSDEDDEFKQADDELKAAVPFAVIGSNVVLEVNGRRVRGRLYPWGIVEVENSQHSDFLKLRQMLMSTHLQDLKDVTEEVHYENFRAEYIQRMEANNNIVLKANLLSGDNRAKYVVEQIQQPDLEKQLLEKEMELKRTHELLLQMQSRLMHTQQQV